MCRPCLYTAHVYRDDVTFDLGRYYIYGLDSQETNIDDTLLVDSWTATFCLLYGTQNLRRKEPFL
jgi:hypothetical protein